MTNHIHTDAGTFPLEVGDTEVLCGPTNRIDDYLALLVPRYLELPNSPPDASTSQIG